MPMVGAAQGKHVPITILERALHVTDSWRVTCGWTFAINRGWRPWAQGPAQSSVRMAPCLTR